MGHGDHTHTLKHKAPQLSTTTTFKPNPTNPSQWIPSSKAPTTSLRRLRRLPLVPPRRPTRVAKDSDASIGTRASAAKDAIGDKAQEKKHEGKGRPTRRPSKLNHISTNNHELNGEETWN